MSNERSSNAIDAYVGRRLKQRRDELGLSQEKLAQQLGISFQQVQKYERGFNRVGASRLFQIAEVMNVVTAYFFEGLEAKSGVAEENELEAESPLSVAALLAAPGAMELLSEYAKIQSPQQRKKIVELVRIFANEAEN
ncbi:MAG: phrR [Hyphomonadaceae bacterium]|nr:MAG: phrR [Hyphomonadaceae bacterium]KAF0187049.1 MAG: phrR [Hyphomonadaceae bacterium]